MRGLYNQQQTFALKGLHDVLLTSYPILSMQCCAAVRATYRKQQTAQL